eukprot:6202378-Pleurochrysis_carterae.AAC.1
MPALRPSSAQVISRSDWRTTNESTDRAYACKLVLLVSTSKLRWRRRGPWSTLLERRTRLHASLLRKGSPNNGSPSTCAFTRCDNKTPNANSESCSQSEGGLAAIDKHGATTAAAQPFFSPAAGA